MYFSKQDLTSVHFVSPCFETTMMACGKLKNDVDKILENRPKSWTK